MSGAEPAKRTSGTYEISGSTLRLRESTGTTKNLSFSYSAANREATIDDRYYEQEPQVQSSSYVCDFD
ncbi:MAG TPA: hypothetical protein VFX59_16350 [Polyangiales bacterium]|nr:hypothetical protein [Polyangiales bacterium]